MKNMTFSYFKNISFCDYFSRNREYAMLRLADENVAKNSRIMMLLISA